MSKSLILSCLVLLTGLTAAEGEIQLPQPGATYEVLGVTPGLKNFAVKYTDDWYRGGMPLAVEGGEAWRSWGIRTVISIAPSDLERVLCEQLGITLVEIEFEKTTLTSEVLDRFAAVVEAAEKPIYVHCHGGTHRGGALSLAYRLAFAQMEREAAIGEYEALGGMPGGKDQPMVDAILAWVDARASEAE